MAAGLCVVIAGLRVADMGVSLPGLRKTWIVLLFAERRFRRSANHTIL